MKTILLICLLAGVVSCTAQQSAQRPLAEDDSESGVSAVNTQDPKEGIRLFTEAIERNTERLKDPALSATEKSDLYYYRGQAHRSRARLWDQVLESWHAATTEDRNRAIADYGAAIAADPSNAEAYRSRGEAEWNNDGMAIVDFTAALKLNTLVAKEAAETYYERGRLYDRLGHPDLAIADYSSALPLVAGNSELPLNPDGPHKSFGAAELYYRAGIDEDETGQYDVAIFDFTKALSAPECCLLDPDRVDRAETYAGRAKAEEHKGQYEQAIADYTKILDSKQYEFRPYSLAGTLNARGDDYAHIGQKEKADLDHALADSIHHDACSQDQACQMQGMPR